jgi:DNA topoisomerase-1
MYSGLVNSLLSDKQRRVSPHQGPKDDPAHPAIYPTGVLPRSAIKPEHKKVYDMIVKRFCNTFAPDAVIHKTSANIGILGYQFIANWETLSVAGWMDYYHFGRSVHRRLVVPLKSGDDLSIGDTKKDEKLSAPPTRYNEATLLSKMESEGLGTKATRADTIAGLINKQYLQKKSGLIPEENALNLISSLRLSCPEILSPELTRSLERKVAALEENLEDEESIIVEELGEIRQALRKLSVEKQMIWKRSSSPREEGQSLGKCPNCQSGNLIAMRSSRTKKRFIRCTNYNKKCRSSSPLPRFGKIKLTGIGCKTCGWPLIALIYSRGKPVSASCANYFCASRKAN